jgi:hypothetical protein
MGEDYNTPGTQGQMSRRVKLQQGTYVKPRFSNVLASSVNTPMSNITG